MIIGVDEVGRGAIAGPLVVVAVGLICPIPGLMDSKSLTPKKRKILAARIIYSGAEVGIGWVSASQIDRFGLVKSLSNAAIMAINQLNITYDEIILDGNHDYIGLPNLTLIKKADSLIPTVSAASIVAKVFRDSYMLQLNNIFPEYGFNNHMGYGTATHIQKINEFGPGAVHRITFAPISTKKNVRETNKEQPGSGYIAETLAAKWLSNNGFRILDRNWKTRWCEIDIIASKENFIHFVEVKYRKTDYSGTGFDYITTIKRSKMKFAAELWMMNNKSLIGNKSTVLSAMQVSGDNYRIDDLVTII